MSNNSSVTLEAATEAAKALRDALVPLITKRGHNPLPGPWCQRVSARTVELGDYLISFGGPFISYDGYRVEEYCVLEVYRRTSSGPHSWGAQELFTLTWSDTKGTVSLESFVRGPWESEVATLLSAPRHLSVGGEP